MRHAGLAALALVSVLPAMAEDAPVDLELVLAVDVSGSMDPEEQRLQRAGYQQALVHPEVLAAIASGPYRRIGLTYVEWAGPERQTTVVPWRVVDGTASAMAFAASLSDAPFGAWRGTSISAVLGYAAGLFEASGLRSDRQVIDISGDGPNNAGLPVVPVRDELADRGITVNGLPIIIRPSGFLAAAGSDLAEYYQDCVITGPGAFVLPVRERGQLVDSIRRKLAAEIADDGPRPILAAERANPTDCMIGEKLRRNWYQER